MAEAHLEREPIFSHRAVGVAPSWHCDASCIHCYIPPSERRKDVFDPALVRAALSALPGSVRWVALTGGEPFLHPRRLCMLVRLVADTGRKVSVVTNGVWALDWGRAEELIDSARVAGLFGITVSIDDYHRPPVPLATLERLLNRARQAGLETHVVGVGRAAKKRMAWLRRRRLPAEWSGGRNLFDLERVGSAVSLPQDCVRAAELRGCEIAMEPMITPDGNLFACCSSRLFEVRNTVLLRGNLEERSVGELLDEASRDYLLAAVAALGPAGLLELLGRKVPRAISRCELCLRLLNDAGTVRSLRRRIKTDKELRKELVGRHMIYEACYRPTGPGGGGS